ncbi:MAG: lipopolysaccharide kinase InaA family protein [Candidatus Binataceae bacterium]
MRPAVDFGWGRDTFLEPGSEFPRFTLEKRLLYLRRDLAPRAAHVFQRLTELRGKSNGAGNRQSAYIVDLEGGPVMYARRSRRGGLIRFFVKDIYFGARPRPVRELTIAAEAYRRGIPVAEPLGAMVEWVAPAIYRGIFLTRAMPGMTLWDFLRTDDDELVRRHVLEHSRLTIDSMHRGGLLHADLNLHNLFVTKVGESFATVIIDLDKSRLFKTSVAPKHRRHNLARLRRSARKLDFSGRYLDARALAVLTAP